MATTERISAEGELARSYAQHLATWGRRLESALEASGADGLVVFAGERKIVHRDDETYPFVADPYFKLWVPLPDAADSLLVLTPGRRPLLAYVQDEGFWHEPPADPEGFWVEHFDVHVVRSAEAALDVARRVAATHAAIGETVDPALGFRSVNDPALLARLDYCRAVKTPYEVSCIRRAAAVAARGHRAVAERFGPRVSELDLHLAYCKATEHRESDLPYPNIIALNEHAAVLHYQHQRPRAPDESRSLLIDAGARFLGYACDITRTWHGRDGRFAALLAGMEKLQLELCAGARAGTDFVALNERAHRLLAALLREQGLVKCSAEQAYDDGITTAFLPHGLGHLLGLQVHDVGGHQVGPDGETRPPPERHPFLRLTRVLEPGFVVTIEPGLYFIPTLLAQLRRRASAAVDWGAVEPLMPFGGIRIEDDVAVTDGAPRNLTREAFASLPAMQSARLQ
ncbi:MAG TPA: Xaa-Pro dipeptidase [Gammaproteobacteria bacterium]